MIAQPLPHESLVFDLAHLTQYTGPDTALQAELLGLMREQAHRCIDQMSQTHDRATWRAACHTLKGAARGVGAFSLADICDEAENMPEASWQGMRLSISVKITETEAVFDDVIAGFDL